MGPTTRRRLRSLDDGRGPRGPHSANSLPQHRLRKPDGKLRLKKNDLTSDSERRSTGRSPPSGARTTRNVHAFFLRRFLRAFLAGLAAAGAAAGAAFFAAFFLR